MHDFVDARRQQLKSKLELRQNKQSIIPIRGNYLRPKIFERFFVYYKSKKEYTVKVPIHLT